MKSFLLAFIFIAQCFSTAAQNKSIFLQNATIIDGEATVAPRKGSLFLKNGRIEKITWTNKHKSIKADTVIDCTGKFICPGLIDAHVHLATIDLTNIAKAQRSTDSIVSNMMNHGITTVRDMAGNAPFLQSYNNAAESGAKKCPAIFYAAQFAGPKYFKMMNRSAHDTEGLHAWSRSVGDRTNIKQIVREAKQAGVTGIKIYAELSPALVAAIAKEAHAQGLEAWSHASVNPARPTDIIAANVNSMSHAADLVFAQFSHGEDAGTVWSAIYKGLKADSALLFPLLQEMKNKNILLDATVFSATNNKMYNALFITSWAHQAGVKIDAGTDWVYPAANAPVPLSDELQLLVSRCGMTNIEAIQSATLYGAQAIGIADRGLVRKGKRADLLILNEDPTRNLDALFHPAVVLQKAVIKFSATK